MKKIGFIGAYDKIDLILYVAKILTEMGKQVLVVDGTLSQKAKYIVPVIKPSKTYITTYENIDIAVGFENFNNIKQFIGMPDMQDLSYDIALVDLDTMDGVEKFELENFEQNYFVTSNDMYSIKKGIESVSNIQSPIKATKVFFSKDALKEEDEYLNFLSLGSKIIWEEERIYFPFEIGDQSIIYQNQRMSKIIFKRLSSQYKEALLYISNRILGDTNIYALKKILKK